MPTDTFAHFVFVDFENVPDVDLTLVENRSVHVTLLIGKHQKKLDLALVRQIHRLAGQVELVEVGATGRNALDLTLAFYLGQSVQQRRTAEFHIVSKDQDFDAMKSHLTGSGVKLARCDAFHLLSFLPRPKPVASAKPAGVAAKASATPKKPAEDRRAKVLARLRNPSSRNRPVTEATLRTYLKTALGKESSVDKVEEVLKQLRGDQGFKIEPDGKISWP